MKFKLNNKKLTLYLQDLYFIAFLNSLPIYILLSAQVHILVYIVFLFVYLVLTFSYALFMSEIRVEEERRVWTFR